MPGTDPSCTIYYYVESGDSCYDIEQEYDITADETRNCGPLPPGIRTSVQTVQVCGQMFMSVLRAHGAEKVCDFCGYHRRIISLIDFSSVTSTRSLAQQTYLALFQAW